MIFGRSAVAEKKAYKRGEFCMNRSRKGVAFVGVGVNRRYFGSVIQILEQG